MNFELGNLRAMLCNFIEFALNSVNITYTLRLESIIIRCGINY